MTFKKNDRVTLLLNWDRKGTVAYRQAIVYSCGKKQMVLTDALTGREIGRNFKPVQAEPGQVGTFPRTEDPTELCLAAACEILVEEKAHFEHCLSTDSHTYYLESVRRSMAELHEPRAIPYPY